MIFDQWREAGREVAVLGLGASGASAARLLLRHGVAVYGSDIGSTDDLGLTAERLREDGAHVELGGHDLDRIARAVVLVVSPGVPPTAPAIRRAREARIQVIAEVDLAALALRKTRAGLVVDIDPPKWAARHVETVERADVSGMSFGFSTLADDWRLEDGLPLRELTDIRIAEVSPVAFPAYPATSIRAVDADAIRAAWRREHETGARLRALC